MLSVSGLVEGAVFAGGSILANDNGLQEGRVFTHWSQYCLLTGAMLATISTVALAIIGSFPAAVVLGTLALIDIVGVYYLKKFAPERDLESDINLLRQRTQKLAAETTRLGQENTRLTTSAEQLQQQLQAGDTRRKAIDAQAKTEMDALNTTIAGLNVALEKEKAALALQQQENLKYQAAEKGTADQAQKTAAAFRDALKSFAEANEAFEKDNDDVEKLSNGTTQLSAILKDLSANNADHTKLMAQLTDMVKILNARFQKSLEVNAKTDKQYDQLQEENKKLKNSVAIFSNSASKIGTTADALMELNATATTALSVEKERLLAQKATNMQAQYISDSITALLAKDNN